MKVVTIVGARPQFIKAAVVSRAFQDFRPDVNEIIIHTGQHYDSNMSDVFFEELNIPKPDYNLGIGGGTHAQNTGRMLEAIESVLVAEKPDWLLVYGDTDSTLAGALAAAKLNLPVAHIEAGLRSFNRKMPEEINRILTDHLSDYLFAPTDTGTNNLIKEGIEVDKIKQVGDVMYDATLYYKNKLQKPLNLTLDTTFVLSTIHRAENTDEPNKLSNIIEALNEVAAVTPVVLPVHPRTRKLLANNNFDTHNLILLEPVSYLEMVWLLEKCELVITDSGGLQKEAYFFDKLCLTTRNETEWVELVKFGVNILVGANKNKIIEETKKFNGRNAISLNSHCIYGNGDAGKKIVEIL